MTLALQIVTSGLVTGLIYMLIALGVTLLFGIMRVVNFVHGELVMLSAFAVYFLGSQEAGLPFWLALLAAIAAAAAVAVICQYLLFRPLHYDILNCFIIGIGASFAIRSASWAIFGPEPIAIPATIPGVLNIGGVFIAKQRLFAAGLCVALAIAAVCVPALHASRQGDARGRAGPRGRAADGDQQRAGLRHRLHHQRRAGSRGRGDAGFAVRHRSRDGRRTAAEVVHHRADRRHGQHRRHGVGRAVHRPVGQRDRARCSAASWRSSSISRS